MNSRSKTTPREQRAMRRRYKLNKQELSASKQSKSKQTKQNSKKKMEAKSAGNKNSQNPKARTPNVQQSENRNISDNKNQTPNISETALDQPLFHDLGNNVEDGAGTSNAVCATVEQKAKSKQDSSISINNDDDKCL